MQNSININVGAMLALRKLNATAQLQQESGKRLSTGLSVASAKDNGAVWSIALGQRTTSLSLNAVKQSLSRAGAIIDVSLAAGQTVSNLLLQMKAKALGASDASLDAASRAALNEDFRALRDHIAKVVASAAFNGANLLKAGAVDLTALANADGTARLTVGAEVMALSGSIVTVAATDSIGTVTLAGATIGAVDASIGNVSAALGRLGARSRAFERHLSAVSRLQDSVDAGVGAMVDADVTRESARFQALQTRQQLGVQALAIANRTPRMLMSVLQRA